MDLLLSVLWHTVSLLMLSDLISIANKFIYTTQASLLSLNTNNETAEKKYTELKEVHRLH